MEAIDSPTFESQTAWDADNPAESWMHMGGAFDQNATPWADSNTDSSADETHWNGYIEGYLDDPPEVHPRLPLLDDDRSDRDEKLKELEELLFKEVVLEVLEERPEALPLGGPPLDDALELVRETASSPVGSKRGLVETKENPKAKRQRLAGDPPPPTKYHLWVLDEFQAAILKEGLPSTPEILVTLPTLMFLGRACGKGNDKTAQSFASRQIKADRNYRKALESATNLALRLAERLLSGDPLRLPLTEALKRVENLLFFFGSPFNLSLFNSINEHCGIQKLEDTTNTGGIPSLFDYFCHSLALAWNALGTFHKERKIMLEILSSPSELKDRSQSNNKRRKRIKALI